MSISNFPVALQPIIQQNYLERAIEEGLTSTLGYRAISDRMIVPNGVGETITKTRNGMLAPVTSPITPSTNTGLDNGLTAGNWTVEQYTLSIDMYAASQDLNTVTTGVGIVPQFLINAKTNGVQAMQSLDRFARKPLFDAYLYGNTRVVTTLGTPGTTVAVDDIRGFRTVLVNGKFVSVDATNTKAITINGTAYTCTGATVDSTNVSTAFNGISGTITTSANVTVANATAGNSVYSSDKSFVIRSGGAATAAGITAVNPLNMGNILDAVATLRNNAVPTIGGVYSCYLDNFAMRELYSDPDFKILFQGATFDKGEYRSAQLDVALGVRFIPTTEAPLATIGSTTIRHTIVVGEGALIEGDFAGLASRETAPNDSLITVVDGIAFVVREPIDRLQQLIAQSWYFIGGWVAPSDITATTTIIPTAQPSRHKRGIVIQHV